VAAFLCEQSGTGTGRPLRPRWQPDADVKACSYCMASFSLVRRRHHVSVACSVASSLLATPRASMRLRCRRHLCLRCTLLVPVISRCLSLPLLSVPCPPTPTYVTVLCVAVQCRCCGGVFCQKCSTKEMDLSALGLPTAVNTNEKKPPSASPPAADALVDDDVDVEAKPTRVCDWCFNVLIRLPSV
jgi:hypothetical protein